MDVSLPLDKMTVEDKLRALEILWEDLCRNPGDVPSPEWHGDVLESRRKRVEEGKERILPWSEVKQHLRPPGP